MYLSFHQFPSLQRILMNFQHSTTNDFPSIFSRHSDFSLLYNPLIYPNSLFWPPTFFLPYQNAAAAAAVAGLTASPESPNLSNHRYTLTPEKDEAVGKLLLLAFILVVFLFTGKTVVNVFSIIII